MFINNEKEITATFISSGTFMHNPGWIHKARIIDSYELIIPINGQLNMTIDNKPYSVSSGDILVIPPNIPHTGRGLSQEFIQFDWVHFKLEKLANIPESIISKKLLNQIGLLLPLRSSNLNTSRISIMFNQLLDVYKSNGDKCYLNNLLNNILYEISMQEKNIINQKIEKINNLQPIKEWIRIHSSDQITSSKVAQYFGYNPSYLSRIYKINTGKTITEEIRSYRLELAKSKLLNTNLTVDEISNLVGYTDTKYFMRIFKS